MTIKYDATGFYNLREAGGMRAQGGRVKTEKLLRSDFPTSLDGEDVEFFQELPLLSVIDLRVAQEIAMAPTFFRNAGFYVYEDGIHVGSFMSMERGAPTVEAMYLDIVENSPQKLAAAVVEIARVTADGAVLVHCTAGKDRTGAVCALTQAVVGVSDADIVANYVQTQANLSGEWLTQMTPKAEAMLAAVPGAQGITMAQVTPLMVGSPASAIQGMLAQVRKESGTVDAFLLANGVTKDDLEALRTNLIEPTS